MSENKISAKIAVIWADIPHAEILKSVEDGRISPMSENVPRLTNEAVAETASIVAQMGVEPIIKALEDNADIIICGRAYDPAAFAAVGIHAGFSAALSYHLGKILECGALCAEPSTTKDCIMGVLEEDSFSVYATNPNRRCSPISVAAHTFYEKDHPYILHGPGFVMDLEGCTFEQYSEGRTKVRGSRLTPTRYEIKLEGARRVGYRTFVIAGVRDPVFISRLTEVEDEVEKTARSFFGGSEEFKINFYNYGINGVMGDAEPNLNNPDKAPYEVCVLFEVVAKTQQTANDICGYLRSTMLHFGFEGRKSTAGNLAFPFAPSDVPFGAVYEFSVYHLMAVDDPSRLFPITWLEVQDGQII